MHDSTTHNIKQLGFSGLQGFGSRFSILVGGQELSPKTQPFHMCAEKQNIGKIIVLHAVIKMVEPTHRG
jgi:hypothetical protein